MQISKNAQKTSFPQFDYWKYLYYSFYFLILREEFDS